ncbi:MAG: hypothetical protein IKG85_00600 [Clostridia bacterium]|nr:hypothetical protein [Clostridia bacterium]
MDERFERSLKSADVLGDIDDSLVTEAAKPRRRRFRWIEAVASVLAAVFVLGTVAAILHTSASRQIGGPAGDQPATEQPAAEQPVFRPKWANTSSPSDAVPEATQVPTYGDRQVFYSQEELEEWILGGPHDDPKDVLYGLSYYYVPEKLPDEAEFQYIEADPDMVWVHYELNIENNFSMGFYKDPSKRIDLPGVEYTEIDTGSKDVYIIDRWLYKTACWEQDGHVLELNVPPYYEEETIIDYCSAVREILPAAPKPDSRFMFHTEKSFFDAISGNIPETSALYGLNGYWALYDPPADRDAISVMEVDDSEVFLAYGKILNHSFEGLKFSYLRDTKPDELEDYLHPAGSLSRVTQYGDVFMTEWEYSGRYGGEIGFYWHQGEDCFCISRTWDFERPEFTEEEVKALCRAGFVGEPVSAEPEPTPEIVGPETAGGLVIMATDENGAVNEILPYRHMLWSTVDYGSDPESGQGSALQADGMPLYSLLPKISDELPVLYADSEIELVLPEDYPCTLMEIQVFGVAENDTAETIRLADAAELMEFMRTFDWSETDRLAVDILLQYSDRPFVNGELTGTAKGCDGYALWIARPETAVFSSLEEFDAAVREGRGDPDSMFYGLEGYYTPCIGFVPDRDPITISASADMVKYEYVCTSTMSNGETDTRDYTFVWHRNADPAEAEELAESIGAGYETFEAVRLINDVWVVWTWGPEMANVWVNESGEVFEFRFPFIMDSNIATWPYATWVSLDEPAATPSYEETPEPETQEEVRYTDLDAFTAALREGRGDPDSVYYGLDGYYLLHNAQTSAKGRFKSVTVTADTIEIEYDCVDIDVWDADENDPNRFVLIWHRGLGADDAEALVNDIISNTRFYTGLAEEDGVWMICSDDEEKHGVWITERGDVLEIIAPIIFDDPYFMLPLAHADWIPVE